MKIVELRNIHLETWTRTQVSLLGLIPAVPTSRVHISTANCRQPSYTTPHYTYVTPVRYLINLCLLSSINHTQFSPKSMGRGTFFGGRCILRTARHNPALVS